MDDNRRLTRGELGCAALVLAATVASVLLLWASGAVGRWP